MPDYRVWTPKNLIIYQAYFFPPFVRVHTPCLEPSSTSRSSEYVRSCLGGLHVTQGDTCVAAGRSLMPIPDVFPRGQRVSISNPWATTSNTTGGRLYEPLMFVERTTAWHAAIFHPTTHRQSRDSAFCVLLTSVLGLGRGLRGPAHSTGAPNEPVSNISSAIPPGNFQHDRRYTWMHS